MYLIKYKVAVRTTDDLVTCSTMDLGYTIRSVDRIYQAHADYFRGKLEISTGTSSLLFQRQGARLLAHLMLSLSILGGRRPAAEGPGLSLSSQC